MSRILRDVKTVLCFLCGGAAIALAQEPILKTIGDLRQADYAGDQAAMKHSYDELAPFTEKKESAARAHYWRGFAMWRRAINGFNDGVDPAELEQDLQTAISDFEKAIAADPATVEPKIGAISCYGYLAFMKRNDPARAQELFGKIIPLIKEVKEKAPDNPRFLWVMGPVLWNLPPERGGGHGKAIENYERALAVVRKQAQPTVESLDPTWGEPELLANLAWSHLNKSKPDVVAAERYARDALEKVPKWHYVRDILLRQITETKSKASP